MNFLDGKITWARVGLLLLSALILLTACSEDHGGPIASTDSEQVWNSDFRYPELTPEWLESAMPSGYRALPMLSSALDACDPAQASSWCNWNQDKTINISHFIEFKYYKNRMNSSAQITIEVPNRCIPVADFYPHPTQFNGTVQMKFKLHEMGYDQQVDLWTVVPMYYNEETELFEELPNYQWEGADRQCLFVWTDHFSRYIIGQRITE